MLKKIFAGLAGALALIAVPPSGKAERQLPVVLDLDAHHSTPDVELPPLLAWAVRQ